MQSYRKIIKNGTCRFNPAAVLDPRQIHIYDNMVELDGESLWKRESPGAKRGCVRGMSASARRRLRVAASRIPKKAVPNFFTTTYQHQVPYDECKRHLDIFGKRMRYHYPDVYMIWRMELQKRGVPHYHFLIYSGPQIINKKGANQEVFNWMRRQWCEVTGQMETETLKASTRYERLRNIRGVHRYITKYLAKKDDGGDIPGRQWGIIGRKSYKSVVEKGEVTCQVMAEKWYEVKKRMIQWLVKQTRTEKWHWAPWWSKLSIYGEWRGEIAAWCTGSLIETA